MYAYAFDCTVETKLNVEQEHVPCLHSISFINKIAEPLFPIAVERRLLFTQLRYISSVSIGVLP